MMVAAGHADNRRLCSKYHREYSARQEAEREDLAVLAAEVDAQVPCLSTGCATVMRECVAAGAAGGHGGAASCVRPAGMLP